MSANRRARSGCAPAAAKPLFSPLDQAEFAARMAPLGPFEAPPMLAVGVSGGADSIALAVLADAWARARAGRIVSLVVDHGLRAESAAEAADTLARLASLRIEARLLTLRGLASGSGLAARARQARHAALAAACTEAGIVHLLLGHHAGDQAETLMARALAGSGVRGLAGMAALSETTGLRRLRPLLGVAPGRLRATLREAGIGWIEDPSNSDPAAQRARLRAGLGALPAADRAAGIATLLAAAAEAGAARAAGDASLAASLAAFVTLHEAGFARLAPGPIEPDALAALLRSIAGSAYAPATEAVAALAARPRAATISGVRLLPAGRLGPGLLVVREAAAMAPPVPAAPAARWDGRFRLGAGGDPPPRATLGGLGAEAAHLRRRAPWPAAVLRTLPALRLDGTLIAVPHLDYPDRATCEHVRLHFAPPLPAAGAPFVAG